MQSLREMAETEGGNPYCARNASYAMWFLKSESYHGIILDAELDEGQWDALEHFLSRKRELRKVPLLIIADPANASELQKLAKLKASGVIKKPLNREHTLSILQSKTLKSKPTKSQHDSRVMKCLVASMRKLIREALNNVPQIGKIQLKPEGQMPDYAVISKNFTTENKKGSLAWSFDTMLISMLAKTWGDDSLIEELDPWYLEEFLKKVDKKIHIYAREFTSALGLNIEFLSPAYLIAPKTPITHVDKDQTLTVSIHHLGSRCQLEVSMITLSEGSSDKALKADPLSDTGTHMNKHLNEDSPQAPDPEMEEPPPSPREPDKPDDSLDDILEIE